MGLRVENLLVFFHFPCREIRMGTDEYGSVRRKAGSALRDLSFANISIRRTYPYLSVLLRFGYTSWANFSVWSATVKP